jgi:hypothetical protein
MITRRLLVLVQPGRRERLNRSDEARTVLRRALAVYEVIPPPGSLPVTIIV